MRAESLGILLMMAAIVRPQGMKHHFHVFCKGRDSALTVFDPIQTQSIS